MRVGGSREQAMRMATPATAIEAAARGDVDFTACRR